VTLRRAGQRCEQVSSVVVEMEVDVDKDTKSETLWKKRRTTFRHAEDKRMTSRQTSNMMKQKDEVWQ